jgi:hypothetical protein
MVTRAPPDGTNMTEPALIRVTVDGKFFRCGGANFTSRSPGPFAQTPTVKRLPARATVRDFDQIIELGANVVRLLRPASRSSTWPRRG